MSLTNIQTYNNLLSPDEKAICDSLMHTINTSLTDAESKIRHGHPVWFLAGNPVVGYSKQKKWICLPFRSGQSFDEENLHPEWKFKAAQICYTDSTQIDSKDLQRWLEKSKSIQRDYKNIVKRRGVLERL